MKSKLTTLTLAALALTVSSSIKRARRKKWIDLPVGQRGLKLRERGLCAV